MTDTADIGERLQHPFSMSQFRSMRDMVDALLSEREEAALAFAALKAKCAELEKERNATQLEYANHRHYHFDWKERAEAAERDLARKHEAYCIASDQAMENGQAARDAEAELATLRDHIEREPVVKARDAAVAWWSALGFVNDRLGQIDTLARLIEQDRSALASAPERVEAEPDFAKSIAYVIKEESAGGAACGWRSCTGCHENNEGVPQGPYSTLFQTHVGMGCSECGGIGVTWEYWSEDVLAAMQEDASPPAPVVTDSIRQQVGRIIEKAILRHGVHELDLEGTIDDADEAIRAALASREAT